MTPLFGHAGWGGIVEALACIFSCSVVWAVGFALAGAVFRSRTLVGLSFVLPVIVVATIELSFIGYGLWAITLLAPLAAASLSRNHRQDLEEGHDTEVPAVPIPLDAEPAAFDWGWIGPRSGCFVVLAALLALLAARLVV